MADAKRAGKRSGTSSEGFTPEEIAAMKEYVQEKRARAKGQAPDGETEVRAKIASMPPSDRVLAEKVHKIVRANAPSLTPRTWYGMPAYSKDGDVAIFFQPASKFKARYATLGFNDTAHLDEGRMWPTAYALTEMTPEEESRIAKLVRRAVG